MALNSHGKHSEEKKYNVTKWMFFFSLFIAAVIVYKVLDNISGITDWIGNLFKVSAPFIIGLVLAYILYLPCKKVENAYKTTKPTSFLNRHARGLSVATVYIMVLIILFIIFSYVIPVLMQSLSDLIGNMPNFYNIVNGKINEQPEDSWLRSEAVRSVINEINNIDYKALLEMNRLTEYAKSAISAIKTVFNIFIATIVSVYILCQRKKLVGALGRFSKAVLSKRNFEKARRYFRDGNEVFFKFLTSQIIDALLIGAILTIALLILKVKYAVLLGFMIGLFNLIPFFGAIVAVIIAIIITLLTGGFWQALLMAVVVIIIQQIDANVINPKIVGDSLNISQLLVIFAVTIGGAYFNVLGMFLAVPIAVVIKMVLVDFIAEREEKNKNNY